MNAMWEKNAGKTHVKIEAESDEWSVARNHLAESSVALSRPEE
jgi:hypothetical protein